MANNTTLPLRVALAQRILHEVPLALPTALDLALYSSAPNLDGTGGTELVGNNYARKSINLVAVNWNRTGGTISNASPIVSNVASGNWQPITDMALFNGTTMWFTAPLNQAITVLSGSTFTFDTGALTIDFSGNYTDDAKALIAEWMFRAGAITWPSALDLALASSAPSAATPGTELVGNGYARLNVPSNTTMWVQDDDNASRFSNGIQFNWGEATGAWLTTVGIDMYAANTGVRWFWDTLNTSQPVNTGNQARFKPDTLSLTFG